MWGRVRKGKCVAERTGLRGVHCVRRNENWGALEGEGGQASDRVHK